MMKNNMVSQEGAQGTGSLETRRLGQTERERDGERGRERGEFLMLSVFTPFFVAISVSLCISKGFDFQEGIMGFWVPRTSLLLLLSALPLHLPLQSPFHLMTQLFLISLGFASSPSSWLLFSS